MHSFSKFKKMMPCTVRKGEVETEFSSRQRKRSSSIFEQTGKLLMQNFLQPFSSLLSTTTGFIHYTFSLYCNFSHDKQGENLFKFKQVLLSPKNKLKFCLCKATATIWYFFFQLHTALNLKFTKVIWLRRLRVGNITKQAS